MPTAPPCTRPPSAPGWGSASSCRCDPRTGRDRYTVPGWALSHPVGVAVSPDGTHIYVTNFRISGTVSVVDTATGAGGTSWVNVWDNPHWKCLS